MKKTTLLFFILFSISSFGQKKLNPKEFEKKREEIESLTLVNLELALQKSNSLLKYAESG